jgi:hypothetical protein
MHLSLRPDGFARGSKILRLDGATKKIDVELAQSVSGRIDPLNLIE